MQKHLKKTWKLALCNGLFIHLLGCNGSQVKLGGRGERNTVDVDKDQPTNTKKSTAKPEDPLSLNEEVEQANKELSKLYNAIAKKINKNKSNSNSVNDILSQTNQIISMIKDPNKFLKKQDDDSKLELVLIISNHIYNWIKKLEVHGLMQRLKDNNNQSQPYFINFEEINNWMDHFNKLKCINKFTKEDLNKLSLDLKVKNISHIIMNIVKVIDP